MGSLVVGLSVDVSGEVTGSEVSEASDESDGYVDVSGEVTDSEVPEALDESVDVSEEVIGSVLSGISEEVFPLLADKLSEEMSGSFFSVESLPVCEGLPSEQADNKSKPVKDRAIKRRDIFM